MRIVQYSTLLLACVVFFASLGCSPSEPKVNKKVVNNNKDIGSYSDPQRLAVDTVEPSIEQSSSLIRILVHPEYYHGKKVCIVGFLRVQREGNAIYLSKDEDQHMMSCNAFWVSFDHNAMKMSYKDVANQFNEKYVYLAGTYDKRDRGYRCGYQGTIKDVTRIQIKLDRSEIRDLLRRESKRGGVETNESKRESKQIP